jgi:Short C-terminal domain
MQRTSLRVWLLLALVAGAVVASRLGRALGPTGIVLAIVLVVGAAVVLRYVIEAAAARSRSREPQPAAPKNVTPIEPALSPGAAAPMSSTARGAPSVIVIDPPDGSQRLAAKLQALDTLRADGLVTDDEYEAKRAKLIADF